MKICSLCGNPVPENTAICPYCNTRQSGIKLSAGFTGIKSINLEAGKPTVEEAMAKLERELNFARSGGVKLIRIIHGYGSSGVGGAIRESCRKYLRQKLSEGRIKAFIPGEDYSISNSKYKELSNRYPILKQKEKTDCKNPGITLIEL
ncbi:MAG TPA: hypothetical protein ENO01_00825 [Candidatus Marinimicrobia bacterium]|nr:hypothetical protein [Candidatus Neomarinimicrobiota bacterium]